MLTTTPNRGHTMMGSSGRTSTKATPTQSSTAATKRTMQRQVIHPILDEGVAHTNDPFWKNKLMLAARGRFPKGFFCRDGFICHKQKNKISQAAIPDTPAAAVATFIGFMQNTGMYSDLDTEYQKEQEFLESSVESNGSPLTWSQVPKKMKPTYLEEFINRIANLYGFKGKTLESLHFCVGIGVAMNIFNKSTIVMGSYRIESINGLEYRDDTFYINQTMWEAARPNVYVSTPSDEPYFSYKSKYIITKTLEKYGEYYSIIINSVNRNSRKVQDFGSTSVTNSILQSQPQEKIEFLIDIIESSEQINIID